MGTLFSQVLDEMFHVLNEIRIVSNPPRAHELLQELRDISSMAMEHFDEKIVPLLKQETQAACSRFSYSDAIASLTSNFAFILHTMLYLFNL